MRNFMLTQNLMASATKRATRLRWLSILFVGLAIGLGLLNAWAAASSHSMNADGISYLDMGDAYMRGDWEMATDSVWSPMYAWVLGAVIRLFAPPMHLEFPVVHTVNFVIYLFALVCFVYFWRLVMMYHRSRVKSSTKVNMVALPDWAMLGIGYTLFITSSMALIKVWSVTPDMLMAAIVYLAAALILRIRLGDLRWRIFIFLGMLLGLSYLAKAIMFPVSILFLFITLFAVRNMRLAIPRVLIAFLAFILFILPYVVLVSVYKGEYTISGAGTFTYAKHVNGVPFAHWQGETPGNGTPVHPSRKIFDKLPIYEFGTPIGGTYPIGYDPSYWYKGLEIYFDPQQQIQALLTSFLFYYDVFARLFGPLVFGIALLYMMNRHGEWRLAELLSDWGLLFIALAVFMFYAVVLVTGRYIGAFVVLFFANLLANVESMDTVNSRRFASALSIIVIIFLLGNLFAFNLSGYRDFTPAQSDQQPAITEPAPLSWPGEVAEELNSLGIGRGDRVGVIGYAFTSFWARLARVKIVAELLEKDAAQFWLGDSELQKGVIDAFVEAGAEAIVAEYVPAYASVDGWHRVGETSYYIYPLTD